MKKLYFVICFVVSIGIGCKKPSTPEPNTVPPTPQMYTVTATAGANGTVTPASIAVASGKSATFTFSPTSGFHTDSLWINGVFTQSLAGATTYTVDNVVANDALKVSFTDALTAPQLDSLVKNLNGIIFHDVADSTRLDGSAFATTPWTSGALAAVDQYSHWVFNVSSTTNGIISGTYVQTADAGNPSYSAGTVFTNATFTISANGKVITVFAPGQPNTNGELISLDSTTMIYVIFNYTSHLDYKFVAVRV